MATLLTPLPDLLNRAPTDEERHAHEASPVDPNAEAATLEVEIHSLEIQLEQKRARLDTVHDLIRQYRTVTSPIRRLPTEVLQNVFLLALPDLHNALLSPEEPPLLLTRICRPWREIALATPELWSTIHIVCLPHEKDMSAAAHAAIEARAGAAAAWIARSGTRPLDVSIKSVGADELAGHAATYYESTETGALRPAFESTVPDALLSIIPHHRRWRQLDLATSIAELYLLTELRGLDLPMLTSFSFSEEASQPATDNQFNPKFLAHAQGLRHLKLNFPASIQIQALLMLVRPSLADLHIQSMYSDIASLDRLFSQIVSCAHLQRLNIAFSSNSWDPMPVNVQGQPTVMPQLRRVHVSGYCEPAHYLLDRIRAPRLEAMEYGAREYTAHVIESLAAFLSRSSTSLTKLGVTVDERTESLFGLCLQAAPMLEDLTLTEGMMEGRRQASPPLVPALGEAGANMLCPRLRSVGLYNCEGVDGAWLLDFLAARTSPRAEEEEWPLLQSVKVLFGTPQPGLEEKVTPYREMGIAVDILKNEWRSKYVYSPNYGAVHDNGEPAMTLSSWDY
ncbi:hypothetical protein BD626DRAFT_492196 [Schizophyllum amplum]|uniref:Uncharacterized protein n=1 Tax=Schizophyllum amplum TaxID=97359 RepID=A0A550CIA9_9AGAR|nr:hypothetical protein BD626DRAFT_492196 [Auriculariopsis ampla]